MGPGEGERGSGGTESAGALGVASGMWEEIWIPNISQYPEFYSAMFFWRGESENCTVEDLNSLTCLRADNYQISAS